MNRVIVAVNDPAGVRRLIRAGRAIARLRNAETVAVHVSATSSSPMVADLQHQGATLEVHQGDPVAVIRALAAGADVEAVVIGSGAGGHCGSSRFVEGLLPQLATPVLVVPACCDVSQAFGRATVLLESEVHGSAALARWLAALRADQVAIRMTYLADVTLTEPEMLERCGPDVTDLVILGITSSSGTGHIPVISEALSNSRTPTLVLAVDQLALHMTTPIGHTVGAPR
jgi:hypothetical protein